MSYTQESKNQSQTPSNKGEELDLSLYVVYDHRVNNQLEKIAKNLFGDLIAELQNCFVQIV